MEERERQQTIIRQKPGGMFYHYTTQEGLLGILKNKSKCIWASHIRYLNDLSEGRVFLDTFSEIIKDYKDRVGLAPQGDAQKLNRAIRGFKQIIASQDVFVTSFSRHGDLLSQWRAYSGKSGGYSIGFTGEYIDAINKGFLSTHAEQFYKDPAPFLSCQYGGAYLKKVFPEQRANDSADPPRQATSLFSMQGERLKNDKKSQTSFLDKEEFFFTFVKGSAITKHEGFRDEEEWRMTFMQKPDSIFNDLKFRPGSSMPIPYLEAPLNLDGRRIGIQKILVGPCPHPKEAIRAVEILLKSEGIASVQVLASKIPYRNW